MRQLALAVVVVGCTAGSSPEQRAHSGGSRDTASPTLSRPDTGDTEVAPLDLSTSSAPIPVPEGTRFTADVPYGSLSDQHLDLFLPTSDEPTPLAIFFHGGGFTGGDKATIYRDAPSDVAQLLERGFAFATVNYRLLDDVDADGVLKPLGDSRRALQFVRTHGAELNIDPQQVVAFGSSAGAGTALWLGAHPDMADADATDPVARASTRLRAVAIHGSQSTYDVLDWPEVVFPDDDLSLDDMAAITTEQRLLSFYGLDDWDEITSEATAVVRAQVDMLELLDGGDAPVWIRSPGADAPPDDTDVLFHHPAHGDAVRQRCLEVGLEEVTYLPALGIDDPSGEEMIDFFERILAP